MVYKINICGKVTCNQKEADFCYDDQALTSAAKNFFYDGKTVTFWFILTVKIAIVANRQSFSHPFGISSAYVWRLLWFLVLSNQSEFKMFCRWNQTVSKDLTFLKHDNIVWLVLYFMEPIKVRQKQERMATDSLLAEKMSTIFNVRGVFLDYDVILPNRRVFVDIFTSYSHSLSYPDQAIKISALNIQRKIITIRLVGRANNWNK